MLQNKYWALDLQMGDKLEKSLLRYKDDNCCKM